MIDHKELIIDLLIDNPIICRQIRSPMIKILFYALLNPCTVNIKSLFKSTSCFHQRSSNHRKTGGVLPGSASRSRRAIFKMRGIALPYHILM
jgi:hypothetical protein